jgi:RNA polymerase sigma factor (sigma-70 family)
MVETPAQIQALTRADRVALFHENMGWAATIARKVHRRLPPDFDLEDLIQEANLATWKKLKEWKPERNSSFPAYAILYVRGAVLMKVRRGAYFNATKMVRERSALGNSAQEEGPATADHLPFAGASHTVQLDNYPAPERELPYQTVERERGERLYLRERLEAAKLLDLLPPAERHVFERAYLDGVATELIAREAGEPRAVIGRRIGSAVRRMRGHVRLGARVKPQAAVCASAG